MSDEEKIKLPPPDKNFLVLLFAIFVVFLVTTFFAYAVTQGVVNRESENRFSQDSLKIQNWVQQRLNIYLLATAGLTNSVELTGNISANQWSSYIRKLGLIEKYPGISSLSYSPRVESQGKTRYILKYIEPLAGREKAIGFDMSSEVNRRHALEKARDTGNLAYTGKVIFPTTNAPGFGFFFPVYDTKVGPDSSIEERRAGLLAIISANFRGTEMFEAIYGKVDLFPNLDFEIYQNDNLTTENLLYDHDPGFKISKDDKSRLATTETIDIDHQKWVILIGTKEGLGLTKSQENLPKIVLFAGIFFSILFLILFLHSLWHHYKLIHLVKNQNTKK